MLSQNESQIFPPTTGGAEKMCQNMNVSLLGKVPLDPEIGKVSYCTALKASCSSYIDVSDVTLENPGVGTDDCWHF